ncbi:MAG TPA: hypothetical protein VFD04_19435, partial [Actinomycetes bacterium]|nr:hypothetical protein [Actinomycetes bacterium]
MARLRTLLGFWLVAYGASSWRRFAYALLVVPAAAAGLALGLAGRGEAAARQQRRLAGRLVGSPGERRPGRPADPAALAVAAGVTAAGVGCWLLWWRFTYAILPVPLLAGCLAVLLAGR